MSEKKTPKKVSMTMYIAMIVIIVVIIVAAFVLAFFDSDKTESDVATTDKSSASDASNIFLGTGTTSQALVGIYSNISRTREDGEYVIDHYYSSEHGDAQKQFESNDSIGSYSNIVDGMMAYVIKEGDTYTVMLGNLIDATSSEVLQLTEINFSYTIDCMVLSSQKNVIYAVVTHHDQDYESRWNEAEFSMSDIQTTTELHEFDVLAQSDVIIHEQVTNLETYTIHYITDQYLVMSMFATEVDWRHMAFFDITKNEFASTFDGDDDFSMGLSSNGRYLAYNADLYSKGGEINPSETLIFDMETLDSYRPSFIADYNWDSEREGMIDADSVLWTNYWGFWWDSDNASFILIREFQRGGDIVYDLIEIDYLKQTITNLGEVKQHDVPAVLGSVNGEVYLEYIGDGVEQIRSFSDNELFAELQGYPMVSLVTIPE